MRETDPRDPSLALCQICANRDHTTLAEGNDGAFHRYNTCLLWASHVSGLNLDDIIAECLRIGWEGFSTELEFLESAPEGEE